MKKIPIKAGKQFAEKYKKDQVIILSWSRGDNMTWVTTYGRTIEDCDQAAQAGKKLKKDFLGWPESACLAEPSRVKRLRTEIKKLKAENKELKEQLESDSA